MRKPLPKRFRDIQRKLRVRRSHAGLGLFTEEPIEKGGFIIEYFGPVMTLNEVLGSRNRYLFETNPRRFIDGSVRENIARYINHSCTPNCEVEIIRGRIYIFARKRIPAGAELAYDYGPEYVESFINPQGCRCVKCRTGRQA